MIIVAIEIKTTRIRDLVTNAKNKWEIAVRRRVIENNFPLSYFWTNGTKAKYEKKDISVSKEEIYPIVDMLFTKLFRYNAQIVIITAFPRARKNLIATIDLILFVLGILSLCLCVIPM